MTTTPTRTCSHIKDDGTPCQATAMSGSDRCFFHNPAVADERDAAQRAGGIERSKAAATLPQDVPVVPLETVQDVVALLADTINQVRTGQIDPRISNAVGYLAGIMLKAMEQSDIDKRLAAMEAVVRGQPIRPGSVLDGDGQDDADSPMRALS